MYHPTPDEFSDPLRYIASIRAEAEACSASAGSSHPQAGASRSTTRHRHLLLQDSNPDGERVAAPAEEGEEPQFPHRVRGLHAEPGAERDAVAGVWWKKGLDLQALYDCVTSRGWI